MARRKPRGPARPEGLRVPDQTTLSLEQSMEAPIAEAIAFLGDRPHALGKANIVRSGRLVSHCHTTAPRDSTRRSFAHPRLPFADGRLLSALGRASPFVSEQALQRRIAHHRITRQGDHVFSSSSIFSRSARDTSSPANLPFQLWTLVSLAPCLRRRSPIERPGSYSLSPDDQWRRV